MVDIKVYSHDDGYLTTIETTWTDILRRACRASVEIRTNQIPELIDKLKTVYETED